MARLLIVLGKGGVGRTTISRALASAHAQKNGVTLFHAGGPAPDDPPHPRVKVVAADPRALFDAMIQRQLHLGPLGRRVTSHPLYEALVDILPGVREAALLHHAVGVARRARRTVILDAPATGHALNLLRAPAQLAEVLAGPARTAMTDLADALRDDDLARVVLVTVPEELPVQETLDTLAALPAQGIHVQGVVVNRMPPPMPANDEPHWPTTAASATPAQALTLLRALRTDAETWKDRIQKAAPDVLILPHLLQPRQIEETLAKHLARWVP